MRYESAILCPDSDAGYRTLHELVQDGWEPIFHWQSHGVNHIILRRAVRLS